MLNLKSLEEQLAHGGRATYDLRRCRKFVVGHATTYNLHDSRRPSPFRPPGFCLLQAILYASFPDH